jgi:protein-tyrosine phosphatase
MARKTVSVLFVCMANICRSPSAHGLFQKLVEEAGLTSRIIVDSAGTHASQKGAEPDPRAQKVAAKRQIDLSYIRSRAIKTQDFLRFDYILAMDSDNLKNLEKMIPAGFVGRCELFLDYAGTPNTHVPDPYFGGTQGFERVFDLITPAAEGLLNHIIEHHLKPAAP